MGQTIQDDPTTGTQTESIHPVIDTLEMRLRCELLREAQESVDPNTVVVKALEYAAEAEQRIATLNARVRTLESLAKTDELSGLLNRRGFYDAVRRELQTSARHNETGVLAYIDLDDFKPINDTLGHAAGDEVLRVVGRQLGTNIRATDFAARLGGDEFAVLFVRADHIPARERARAMLEELNNLRVAWKRKKLPVHASMGLANYTGDTAFEELLAQSDRAMYREKRKARERLSSHTDQ
jgi:diguanylate cyclase (GGDEF)-like protein